MVFTLLYSISYGEFLGKSPLLVPPRWPSKAGSGSKNPVIHRRKSGESCSTQEEKERRIPRVTGGEKERCPVIHGAETTMRLGSRIVIRKYPVVHGRQRKKNPVIHRRGRKEPRVTGADKKTGDLKKSPGYYHSFSEQFDETFLLPTGVGPPRKKWTLTRRKKLPPFRPSLPFFPTPQG
jgi:hypothetical protein